MDKELSDALSEMSKAMKKDREDYEKQNEEWWNNLSQEERENAFYAVVKRVNKAENIDKRSFRGAIYGVFGFDPGMYGRAMDCGYMEVHNAIFDGNEFMEASQATSLQVINTDKTVVTWPDVENLTITTEDGKVTVEINKGNPYV